MCDQYRFLPQTFEKNRSYIVRSVHCFFQSLHLLHSFIYLICFFFFQFIIFKIICIFKSLTWSSLRDPLNWWRVNNYEKQFLAVTFVHVFWKSGWPRDGFHDASVLVILYTTTKNVKIHILWVSFFFFNKYDDGNKCFFHLLLVFFLIFS